ncbi:leucine-rich repeat domain-containing protein [Chloroflexota bacterium]
MRRKLLSIVILFILLASTLTGCGQGQPTATPAIFSTSGGNVSVMKEGSASWMEAEAGMSLELGDCIKCGGNSSAEITFLDGSTIELEAGTEIEIVSLDISAETDSSIIKLKQTIGSIIFRVTKIVDPASHYEVETPTGVVAIRGSAVHITVIEDGTTWATNLEGDIWAVAQGVELQIPEGRQCIIKPDEPPELTPEVTFADPNLEAAIREAIGKLTGKIYASDLEELTSLNATERNIIDLTGLENATSLTHLELRDNEISDISPLADLASLTWLALNYNQISDISSLANLTSLTLLSLEHNQISDISPLANLTSLAVLSLYGNQVSDISPLASLSGLTKLQLGINQISDISPLANLTSLPMLSLEYNQISDISPLANLTSLTHLYLGHNQISDISPLANLTSLFELWLDANQISDISPIVGNQGISEGDEVNLWANPLSSDSINVYLPQLQARGVDIDLRLFSPTVGSTAVPVTNIDFTWGDLIAADAYDWVLSPNPDLSSPIEVKTGLTSPACTYTGTLVYDMAYYWQVIAFKEGAIINGSSIGTFTTIAAPS